ncbi:MAG: hypothetical protein Q8R92_03230 [Deltaproteobacteria bacterium]|nr:hypothetical protein [Deltaproteobacteria bacterium]
MAEREPRKAKGTLVAQHVRILRRAKDESLLEEFSPEIREVVMSYILPSSWYPYEVYERTLDVIFNKLSNAQDDAARGMGQFMASSLLMGPYSMYLKPGDPAATLKLFPVFWKNCFNFGKVNYAIPPKAAAPQDSNYVDMDIEDFPDLPYPLYLIAQGFLNKTVELAGGSATELEMAAWKPGLERYPCRIRWEKALSR